MLATLILATLLMQQDPAAAGLKALEGEKYAEAAALLEKAIAADPKDLSSQFNLALAHTFLNQDAPAIAAYRRVLALQPGLYEASLNLGMVLLRAKQPAEAVAPLQDAAKAKPKEARPRVYLADALQASGAEPAAVEAAYREALTLDDKSAASQLGLGRALAKQAKWPEAITAYQSAVALDPQFKDTAGELAAQLEAAGRKADAIALYQTLDSPAARERVAMLQLDAGELAAAITSLEAAVKASPTVANRLALASAYLRNKEPEKSQPLLEAALGQEPNNLELRMTYGRLQRDLRKFDAAAQQFYFVTKQEPKNVQAWRELSAMLISLKQDENALACFARLKELGDDAPAHDFFRAVILDRNHQFQPALDAYRRFLSRSEGKFPDEEFKSRQRARILEKELSKR
ncbi:MAG: tetratricopeptide repeat protein [Bryobacteraceae bacterium]|nr:tetratricopeptide repeat protein [Bryobacteraceae bacterium]